MKRIACVMLIFALLAALFGCGKKAQAPAPSAPKPTAPTKPNIAENDVFAGHHFDQMLWGYYEASTYDYTGDSLADTAEFLQDMDYVTVPTKYGKLQMSVLPLDIQFGSYSQFMNAFPYDGKYYSAYTEKGKAMFRKAYMEEFGDMTAEDFQKIEKLLRLNVAQLTFAQPDGDTQLRTFAYALRENELTFYELSVDDRYNATIGKAYTQYSFLHDGGKLILNCGGIRREYLAKGYKAADKGNLRVAGFAPDRSKQYENLEGFVLTESQEDNGFQIDMTLTNGARPVDAKVTLDKTTGDFSVTWTKSAYYSGQIQHKEPRVIRGKLIPCTDYGFCEYSGFYLLIDGNCYSYLVSEEDYKERKYTNLVNGDVLPDLQRDKLADIKVRMLSQIEQACQNAELPASVDFLRGQVALETDRLFGMDSWELSQEGQDVLQQFTDILGAAIVKEEYSRYISQIVIEGHTDADGRYSQKQTLSKNRAETVANSCTKQNPYLGKEIQSAGCAYDYPIFYDDGAVNADESNRMVFRFLLTAD